MGAIHSPDPVLPLLAVTSRQESAFHWSRQQFESEFGPVQWASPCFVFDQTNYYTATMGDQLKKQFLVPQRLSDPGELSRWKHLTNRWEQAFCAGGNDVVVRPLNLDPGYISQDKLVLASTKNHAHRLYLAKGIYGEVTLQFRSRRWQPCPWTYPDYCQLAYHDFFLECRQYLRQKLRSS